MTSPFRWRGLRLAAAGSAGLLLAGLLAAAGSADALVPAAPRNWTLAGGWGQPTGSSDVMSIASTGRSDAFAAGTICGSSCSSHNLAVRHWTGKKWATISPPPGLTNVSPAPNGVLAAASSATNAWVFPLLISPSSRTDALHWNGKHWGAIKFPAFSQIVTAATFGSQNAWAFGTAGMSSAPFNVRYNGKKWVTAHPPGDPQALSAPTANDLWAIGPTTKTAAEPQSAQSLVLMHWNGSKWLKVSLPAVSLGLGSYITVGTITALGPANVWETYGIGNAGSCCFFGGLEHWNGSKWHRVSVPFPAEQVTSTASDGHGGLWLSVRTDDSPPYAFYHVNSGHWTRKFPPAFLNVTIVPGGLSWIPGTRELWSGGEGLVAGKGIEGVILGYGTP